MRAGFSLLLWLVLSTTAVAELTSLGGSAGMIGNTTGVNLETRWPAPPSPGVTTTSFRVGIGYTQSADSTRRYIPVYCDLLYNFPAGYLSPLENYAGFGFNLVAYTTGHQIGSVGPEVFYGVESNGFGGRVFGEIGLANLRTGFAEEHQGATLLIGWRNQLAD